MKNLRSIVRKYYVRQVIACWMMCSILLSMVPVRTVMANPLPGQLPAGWEIVSGSVGGFDYSTANELHIRNIANGTIIKWNGGFNIGSAAWTEFQLINSGASVLNRDVTGSMSQIYGKLTANGQVWIVNPAGVFFGKGATINVNGLVASALNITNDNFLNGQYEFAGGNGSVINQGNISAQSVYLVGKQVTNAGSIQCPDGYVVMAAADKVYLGQPGGNIIVEIGSLVPPNAEQTQLSSQIINEGTVDADSGTIILAASGDALSRPIISNFGSLSTSTAQGNAGNISLQANNGEITNTGEITAISDNGIGGTVTADAEQVINSGTFDVSGLQGGTVDLLATSHLEQAGNIHADGFESNGGNINLTAEAEVVLRSESLTTANAGLNGDGGKIVAYSPQLASFEENARIEAIGGEISGNGGFVELSGLEGAMAGGFADLRAPAGQAGTFLLDPRDVTISNDPTSYGNVNVSWLEQQLSGSNVTIDTAGEGGEGDITVVDAIGLGGVEVPPWTQNNLTLDADDDIFVNAQIINSGTGDLYLLANDDITINGAGTAISLNNGHLEARAGRVSGGSTISINAPMTAASMLIEAGNPSINNSGNVNITGDDVLLETTNGDLEVTAREHITLAGDLDAQGNIYMFADSDMLGVGNLATGGTINATGNVTLIGHEVTVNESVEAGGNILIKGMADVVSGGSEVEVQSTLTTDNGDIEVMVAATEWDSEIGYVEVGYHEDGLILLGGDVTANGGSSDIKIYNNTEVTADVMTMQAGHDIILTEQCQTLTGKSQLTLDAIGGQIDQGDATITVTNSELSLKQFDNLDMAGRGFGNKESTDVTLQSYAGYVQDLTADDWASVKATAYNGINLEGSDDITTKELTTITNNIYVHSTGGDLIVNGDITADPIIGDVDKQTGNPLGGGVSLIADEGKIYTENEYSIYEAVDVVVVEDTLNVSITGYSDDYQNVGVELPKHFGQNESRSYIIDGPVDSLVEVERPSAGKAAIVIMSEETLKLGPDAELTANGIYDSEGVVDDRPGVDFLNVIEGDKNPGEPIDVAIYLASNAGNVKVDSPVNIAPYGVIVVDAYDTVEPFGAGFIDSLDGIHWLEVCSRLTPDLAYAQTNDTLPYADNTGLFPGSGKYVLRGETEDVGTGAWKFEDETPAPVKPPEDEPTLPLQEIVEASDVNPPTTPDLEDTGQMIGDKAFDDMQWMARELGLCEGDEQGEDENLCQEITQAYLAGAFLQATDLRPYRAAARLRDLVEILHDTDGTRIAGLIRTVNEFSNPEMPPSPEQFASIAQAFVEHSNDGTHYAAAGQWLDSLTEYVDILTADVGWSHEESVAFVMSKYGTSITETGDISVTAYVQMHLEGIGG